MLDTSTNGLHFRVKTEHGCRVRDNLQSLTANSVNFAIVPIITSGLFIAEKL